ncbi:hypothetical protein WME89_19775 [Sorangium sp. So ce321]|uniref:aspartate-alanine antiporter-like transporter n=1 Tax=Sorangium sp. So ce321 TaxID=3133300 RepID=UPI003F63C51B
MPAHDAELQSRLDAGTIGQRLTNVTVRVARDEALGVPAGEIRQRHGCTCSSAASTAASSSSGYSFARTLQQGGAAALIGSGAVTTAVLAFGTLLVGHRLLRIPMGTLTGMLAGIQMQSAVLAFSLEQARSDAPGTGHASVYPVATLVKIVAPRLPVRLL